MRIRFLSVAASLCAVGLVFSGGQSARAEGNIFEHLTATDPYNWSGWYAGFNSGATWNHFDLGRHSSEVNLTDQFYEIAPVAGAESDVFATFDFPGHDKTDTAPVGGGQTGFNFQFGHFVVGGEGGFSGNKSDEGSRFTGFQSNELFLVTEQQFVTADTEFASVRKVETDWNGFIGGRVGFAWGRFLFYGSGGAAFTDVQFTAKDTADTAFFGAAPSPPPGIPPANRAVQSQQEDFIGEIVNKKTSSHRDVLTGWYGGGGASYALTNTVSVGVDYKHVDWGDMTDHFSSGGPVFPGDTNIGLSGDQLTFQVNIMLWPFH
jgi:opacity protein-like surface antigen